MLIVPSSAPAVIAAAYLSIAVVTGVQFGWAVVDAGCRSRPLLDLAIRVSAFGLPLVGAIGVALALAKGCTARVHAPLCVRCASSRSRAWAAARAFAAILLFIVCLHAVGLLSVEWQLLEAPYSLLAAILGWSEILLVLLALCAPVWVIAGRFDIPIRSAPLVWARRALDGSLRLRLPTDTAAINKGRRASIAEPRRLALHFAVVVIALVVAVGAVVHGVIEHSRIEEALSEIRCC